MTQKTNNKMAERRFSLSVITLDANGLNFPIKRQGLAEQMGKKKDSTICSKETLQTQRHKMKVKGWEKIYYANRNQYIHRLEYFSAIKMTKVLIHATTWMNFENTVNEARYKRPHTV